MEERTTQEKYESLQNDLQRESHRDAYPLTHQLGERIQDRWEELDECLQRVIMTAYEYFGEEEHSGDSTPAERRGAADMIASLLW